LNLFKQHHDIYSNHALLDNVKKLCIGSVAEQKN